MATESSNLPAQIADMLLSISNGLTPGVLKSLDRLLGAAVEIPVAFLVQRKVKIEAQTESYRLLEAAVAKSAVIKIEADPATAQRAIEVLVRKEYRKQVNREEVAAAMIEDLRDQVDNVDAADQAIPTVELDDDWLNVFERYAEDASSERLQKLWGRVLAGQIRRPGRFSTRTLRFLSEFSQADALTFEGFAKCSFGDIAPKKLVRPPEQKDIRDLIYLESSGLIQGASGLGLQNTFTFDDSGNTFFVEGNLVLVLRGEPNTQVLRDVLALTPLGQELLGLVPSRNAREAARTVAQALRDERIYEAYLAVRTGTEGLVQPTEVLWLRETPETAIVEG